MTKQIPLESDDLQEVNFALPTGFVDLDAKIEGLHPGELIVVAGRPGIGKTTFSLNVAVNVALDSNRSVGVFSMEMSAHQLAMRMLGSFGRLELDTHHTSSSFKGDWLRLINAPGYIKEIPLYVDESPDITAMEIYARAQHLACQCKNDKPLGLIVFDYLQLMPGNGNGENRATEISETILSLKSLAKDLHVPVIVLSQISRSLMQRPDKRPVILDLRESNAIEEIADVILFIYRDEICNPDSQGKGTAEIIIGKHRNGPLGTARLTYKDSHFSA